MNPFVIGPVRLVTPEGIRENYAVEITDDKITRIDTLSNMNCTEIHDGKNLYLSAGFIDIHLHGGGGHDFMDATEDAFVHALQAHLDHGTTAAVPTTLTATLDELHAVYAAEKAVKAKEKELKLPEILGVHMEGPYIAPAMAGAQDPQYIRTPEDGSWREIVEAADGDLLIWTVAPELAGACELCSQLKEQGIYFSIGHSDARYSDVVRAVDCGYTMATHLYSGMSTIIRENGYRILGAIESSLLMDELTVEVIADGKHLPPELLKLIYKTKGYRNMILITDAMRGAGMPDGEYLLGSLQKGQLVSVFDGIAHMPDGIAFAGSVATTDRLVRVMVQQVGIPLHEAVTMVTANPAAAIGISDRKGVVKCGYDADLVLFDEQIQIQQVYLRGECVRSF